MTRAANLAKLITDANLEGTLDVTGIGTFTDDIIIGDGKTIGSASDVDAITIASNGQLTLTQTLIGTSLDISGDIDVDGITNLDVVDIDGTLNVQGETTLQTHLNMGDDDKIKLGASGDLEIYHDGSNSYIDDTGTGGLLIRVDDALYIRSTGNENMIFAQKDGQVRLYHDNSQKLNTSSSGVTVTGAITASNGDVTLTNGNLVVASGHGIDFSAASGSAGGSASALLDDYEEGTWTPALTNSYGSRQGTWGSSLAGTYTKVGRKVTVFVSIVGSGMYFSSERGYQQITGMPFTANHTGMVAPYAGSWGAGNVTHSNAGTVYLSSASMYMHSAASNVDTSGTGHIGITLTYFA